MRIFSLRTVFTLVLLLSAVLLFSLQPLAAKQILPQFGGSPSVWNICNLTFQLLLLGAYAYAHCIRRLPPLLHCILLLLCLTLFPLALVSEPLFDPTHQPIAALISWLALAIAPLFFILATSAPLLQAWFSRSSTQSPYPLYVASNVGSIVALLSYPILVERLFSSLVTGSYIEKVAWVWGAGVIVCACITTRSGARKIVAHSQTSAPTLDHHTTPLLTLWATIRWLFLAAVPSALMLAVTTHITTNVAAVPLLWIIPLLLYLLSFVLVFAERVLIPHTLFERFSPLVIGVMLPFTLYDVGGYPVVTIALHFALLFWTAMLCHGELVRDKPGAEHLTRFYLTLSCGGALGGAFCSLIAPVIFTSSFEYPLLIILAVFALKKRALRPRMLLLPTAVIGIAALLLYTNMLKDLPESSSLAILFAAPLLCAYPLRRTPLAFALCIGASFLFLVAQGRYQSGTLTILLAERDFYGPKSVVEDRSAKLRYLEHGTINHGMQSTDVALAGEPLAYFHKRGPVGDVLRVTPRPEKSDTVGIIGLGIGAIATYARSGDEYDFYELDPAVAAIATDPHFFTFMSKCAGRSKVILGDGRLQIAKVPDARYRLLFLDAFSSDSVPVHLLTKEAITLYLTKVQEDGAIIFNVSNKYLNLEPVLAASAAELQLIALKKDDVIVTERDAREGKFASSYMVLTKSNDLSQLLLKEPGWRVAQTKPTIKPWTDNYSNLFATLF